MKWKNIYEKYQKKRGSFLSDLSSSSIYKSKQTPTYMCPPVPSPFPQKNQTPIIANTNNSESHKKDYPHQLPSSLRYRPHLQLLYHRRQRRFIHTRRRKQRLRIARHAQPTIPIVRMLMHNRIIPINDFLLWIFEILVDVRHEFLCRGWQVGKFILGCHHRHLAYGHHTEYGFADYMKRVEGVGWLVLTVDLDLEVSINRHGTEERCGTCLEFEQMHKSTFFKKGTTYKPSSHWIPSKSLATNSSVDQLY